MAAIDDLARIVAEGLPPSDKRDARATEARQGLDSLFADRYKRAERDYQARVVLPPGGDVIPFAGLIQPDNPASGAYGGMSWIWFPTTPGEDDEPTALLTLVCGTRGLSPDEAILGRPGHARLLKALSRHLAKAHGIRLWVKHDPTNLTQDIPAVVRSQHPAFKAVFERYGPYLYAVAPVPREPSKARALVHALLDFYARERGWELRASVRPEVDTLHQQIDAHVFPRLDQAAIVGLLRERRFVIIEGPPGTGKTRMARSILNQDFGNHGMSVQFHPAVSYEQFVAGISPDIAAAQLNFRMAPGMLVQAIRAVGNKPYLLHIDEVNRADLARVLGEAIYLFEPREIAEGKGRTLHLPQPLEDGTQTITMPERLYILGTMNSADRSIAILDMAMRRRFAFVPLWPNLGVITAQGLPKATEAFVRLQQIFVQYAPDDALTLLPGHSYFLAKDEAELARRMRYELIPLLGEYLQEGRLGGLDHELRAYLDWLESEGIADGA